MDEVEGAGAREGLDGGAVGGVGAEADSAGEAEELGEGGLAELGGRRVKE